MSLNETPSRSGRTTWASGYFDEVVPGRDIDIRLAELRAKFLAQVTARMERRRMSRAGLAARLGVSRGFITQLFTGRSNLTMRTIAAITEALDCDLEFELKRSRISLPVEMKQQLRRQLRSSRRPGG